MTLAVDCPSIAHDTGSGLNAVEIEALTSGNLCGSLDACATCTLIGRGEQATRALALVSAGMPSLRTRVGELT